MHQYKSTTAKAHLNVAYKQVKYINCSTFETSRIYWQV